MKFFKTFAMILMISFVCAQSFAQEIKICTSVRGTTGLEKTVKDAMERKFNALTDITSVEDKNACHVYVNATLVENKTVQFYALGFCIAYRLNGKAYSRPVSDVAQFGKDKMEEVCAYMVKQIDRAFLEPLRTPAQK